AFQSLSLMVVGFGCLFLGNERSDGSMFTIVTDLGNPALPLPRPVDTTVLARGYSLFPQSASPRPHLLDTRWLKSLLWKIQQRIAAKQMPPYTIIGDCSIVSIIESGDEFSILAAS